MTDKKLTYAQQMAEVNALTSQKYVAVKAAPHKGGTLPMKALLTKWGVKPFLYSDMLTNSIYKCIGLGETRCIAGFTKKEVLTDGYGTTKDVQWLIDDITDDKDKEEDYEDLECTGCCRPLGYGPKGTVEYCSSCKQERIDVIDEMDERMEALECASCLSLMGFAPRGTVDYCRSCMARRHADNEQAKKKDLAKRQELGDMLMKHGHEMIHIKDMSAKEMGVMLQGIIATKKTATAAKSAATKAAKKAGNK